MPCAGICPTTCGARAGKLQRVAAVPVLSKGARPDRGRNLGGRGDGQTSGRGLEAEPGGRDRHPAARAGDHLDGARVLPRAPVGRDRRAQEADRARHKRTRPITLAVGSDRLLAVAAPFVGQAGEQGGLLRAHRQDDARHRPAGAAEQHHGRRPHLGQLPLAGAGPGARLSCWGWGWSCSGWRWKSRCRACARRCSAWPGASCTSWTTPPTPASSAASPAT